MRFFIHIPKKINIINQNIRTILHTQKSVISSVNKLITITTSVCFTKTDFNLSLLKKSFKSSLHLDKASNQIIMKQKTII